MNVIRLPEIKTAELSTYGNFAKCHQAHFCVSCVWAWERGYVASTVLSRKSAHGRCILLSHQTGGWALFRVFPHSTLKECPPLFTYTSSAIAAIEQQARVRQSPPSTSTLLESLAISPLTTSSSLPPSAG